MNDVADLRNGGNTYLTRRVGIASPLYIGHEMASVLSGQYILTRIRQLILFSQCICEHNRTTVKFGQYMLPTHRTVVLIERYLALDNMWYCRQYEYKLSPIYVHFTVLSLPELFSCHKEYTSLVRSYIYAVHTAGVNILSI